MKDTADASRPQYDPEFTLDAEEEKKVEEQPRKPTTGKTKVKVKVE